MTGKSTPVVFVTANVGSIFEEPSQMLQTWANEFLSTISRLDPKFVALHCQEVGGKNYEKSMQYVDKFVQILLASEELRLFDKVRIYLDEDFSSADKFTALGNFYFIHESLSDVLIYNFATKSFDEIDGIRVFTKDIEEEPTKEKDKFPLEYFPECKWSRKGFLRTRWSIEGTVFDLVNIHLFHDASNFVAMESFPSEYSETRRQALIYTLERFHNDEHDPFPVFIFGDFNFRTDTKAVVQRLSEGLNRSEEPGDESTVDYSDDGGKVLSLGKKTFSHLNHQVIFCDKDADWLRAYDKELESFKEQLFEFHISFQPTYPFEEGETGGKRYMETRCPAWCDRVLLTKDALPLVKDALDPASIEYGLIGRTTCMGDHKPVYLKIEVKPNMVTKLKEESSVPASRGDADILDRSGLVKRVNSASMVESRGRREDWQSARCNSDVSWNPTTSRAFAGSMKKPLLHGSSRIRLVSPSSSIRVSLPRLTSHHSSSDEEWFEVIDGDDDVLEMKREPDETAPRDKAPFSILKRLSKKDSVDVFEAVAEVEPRDTTKPSKPKNIFVLKTQSLLKSVRGSKKVEDVHGSWETIDLSDYKAKEPDQPQDKNTKKNCCCLQ